MPHSKTWLALGSLALLAVACAETPKHAEMVTAGATNVPTPPNVDRTKCDEKGKNVITADTNLDQKADVWKFYQSVDVGGQKTEILTCKEVDLNHDGKIDLVYYYDDKGATLTLDEADTDFDGKFDMTRYYANGKVVREELDTNFDGKPDVWKYFEDEKLVRQERDTNGDGKVDEWEYYEGGKLDRIGYDTTGNGTVNKWDRAPENDEESAAAVAQRLRRRLAAPALRRRPRRRRPRRRLRRPSLRPRRRLRGQACRLRPPPAAGEEVAPAALSVGSLRAAHSGASRARAICRLVAPLRVRSADGPHTPGHPLSVRSATRSQGRAWPVLEG